MVNNNSKRSSPRVIAHAIARGYEKSQLYATFHCKHCAYTEKKQVASVKEINTGIACPRCNSYDGKRCWICDETKATLSPTVAIQHLNGDKFAPVLICESCKKRIIPKIKSPPKAKSPPPKPKSKFTRKTKW